MNKDAKKLNKLNNAREKLILEENDKDYTNMIVYIRGANISEYNQELVRSDLIELILDGQERGDNIKKIIGENYKEICDEIINSLPKLTVKENILSKFNLIILCLLPLLIIKLIFSTISNFTEGKSLMNIDFTYADMLNSLIIILFATLIVNYVIKNSFKIDDENKILLFVKAALFLLLFNGLIVIAYLYLDIVFVTLPIWAVLITIVLLYLVMKNLIN